MPIAFDYQIVFRNSLVVKDGFSRPAIIGIGRGGWMFIQQG